MIKKLVSLIAVIAILFTIGGTSAFAKHLSAPPVMDEPVNAPAEPPAKKAAKPTEQLKAAMLKLVADARAGKVRVAPKSQIQPGNRNNLSKGTKIAIGVGIAVVVVLIIVVVHEKNHLFDDFRLGN